VSQNRSEPRRSQTLREISDSLRPRKVGPLQRLVLFASGTPIRLLELVQIERTEFLIQGTGVLLAASLSFVSAFMAAGLIIDPAPSTPMRILVASLVAALIFTVDRTLVRSTLRPHQFPTDVLHTLWDPNTDAKWYQVLAGTINSEGPLTRLRGFFSVVFKAALRFLLALLVSYLVADLIVIDAFRPTVDARATSILKEQRQSAIDKATSDYRHAVDVATGQVDASGRLISTNGAVRSATSDRDAAKLDLTRINKNVDLLMSYEQAEFQGVKGVRVTLSDGVTYPADPRGTTGVPGCATECRAAQARLAAERSAQQAASARYRSAQQTLENVVKTADARTKIIASQSESQIAVAKKNQTDALAAANKLSTKPAGLLIRREALHQLEQDKTPWLATFTPEGRCSSSFRWLCELKRSAFPSTPLGTYVGVFRAILFLIDILPVLLKIFYSLRKRRAYDVLVAALEEASVADSMNKLDFTLNDLGADMEDRAATRRGRRSSSGARLLRESRATTLRQRKQLERSIRKQVREEVDEQWLSKKVGMRQWFRARAALRWHFRRPTQVVVVDREVSPWSEPRYFEGDAHPQPQRVRDTERKTADADLGN
jgi:hypothetical protein